MKQYNNKIYLSALIILLNINVSRAAYYSTQDAWKYGILTSTGLSLLGFIFALLMALVRKYP